MISYICSYIKATNFVVSARELFGLMLKLRQAKKKIQEEKEATSKDPERNITHQKLFFY